MTKHVFSSADDVIEAWAKRDRDYGHDRRRYVHFEGPMLSVYGSLSYLFEAPNGTLCCAGLPRSSLIRDAICIHTAGSDTVEAIASSDGSQRLQLIQKYLEAKIQKSLEEIDKYKDGTNAQSHRYMECANLVRAHQAFKRAFGKKWAALASVDELITRANLCQMSHRLESNAAYQREREHRNFLREQCDIEKAAAAAHPVTLPWKELVAEWRAGNRHWLPDINRPYCRDIYLRYRDGLIETSTFKTISISKFKEVLRFIELEANEQRRFSSWATLFGERIEWEPHGLSFGRRFSSETIPIDDIVAVARVVAPRKAEVLAQLHDMDEDDDEDNSDDIELELPQP